MSKNSNSKNIIKSLFNLLFVLMIVAIGGCSKGERGRPFRTSDGVKPDRVLTPVKTPHRFSTDTGDSASSPLQAGTTSGGAQEKAPEPVVFQRISVPNEYLEWQSRLNSATETNTTSNGTAQDGAVQNGTVQNGSVQNGAAQNGSGQSGSTPNGSEPDGASMEDWLKNFSFPLDIKSVVATVDFDKMQVNLQVKYTLGGKERVELLKGSLNLDGYSKLFGSDETSPSYIRATSQCINDCHGLFVQFFAWSKAGIKRADFSVPVEHVFGQAPAINQPEPEDTVIAEHEGPAEDDELIPDDAQVLAEGGGYSALPAPIVDDSLDFFRDLTPIDEEDGEGEEPAEVSQEKDQEPGHPNEPPQTKAKKELTKELIGGVVSDPRIDRDQQKIPFQLGPNYPGKAVGNWNKGSLRIATNLGSGLFGIKTQFPSTNYGTGLTLRFLELAADDFFKKFDTYLFVTRISDRDGGKMFRSEKTLSHQNGLDVDLRYPSIKKIEEEGAFTPSVQFLKKIVTGDNPCGLATNLDLDKFWNLLMTYNELGNVNMIFTSSQIKKALCCFANSPQRKDQFQKHWEILFRLRVSEGHKDHYHLRLKCTGHNPSCTARGPTFNLEPRPGIDKKATCEPELSGIKF